MLEGRTTITDVAREAGVSVATVSKVINGRDGVAPATQDRVRAVVARLGFVSSLGARSLRAQRTGVLGVLVNEFEPYSTEILKGAWSAVRDSPYELMSWAGGTRGGDHTGWERRSLARLAGTLIDGAILVTPSISERRTAFPLVAIDPHTGPLETPSVDADNLGGALSATEHLVSLGHRRIAFLCGRRDLESARLREQGFRDAMAAAGLEVHPSFVRVGDYDPDRAEVPIREMLSLPDRPTAVFAANDLTAIRTVQIAAELGLRVPRDLSVIGFDNIPESALTTPALTTVRQPLHEIGAAAMRMLLAFLAGEEVTETQVRLRTTLVVRESTGPAAAEHGARLAG